MVGSSGVLVANEGFDRRYTSENPDRHIIDKLLAQAVPGFSC
jgi:hypothetical protein